MNIAIIMFGWSDQEIHHKMLHPNEKGEHEDSNHPKY